MSAQLIRRILEELVTGQLQHWRVDAVTHPVYQSDRDVVRVTVTFEIDA